ncbi:hypothetical protein C0J52_24900 [Blattella germanica]|nr:hypothetical protein C0J52_24900 [Blattella germanica]
MMAEVGTKLSQQDEACQSKYKKTRGFSNTSGEYFEIKMIALLFLRAVKEQENFHIASNMEAAGTFDDIILKFGQKAVFLQLKHRDNAKSVVAASQLKQMRGDFSLIKYYKSYLKMKVNWGKGDLKGYGEFEDTLFILFTNNPLEKGIGTNFITTGVHNLIMTTGKCTLFSDNIFYKLFESIPHYKQLLLKAIDNPEALSEALTKEILEVVRLLHNNSAKSIPNKKELENLMQDFKELEDLSYYRQFLSQIYFYSEQKSQNVLDRLIKKEMKEVCGSDKMFPEFFQRVHNWWQNDKFRLTDKVQFWKDIVKSSASEFTKCVQPWHIKFTEAECNKMNKMNEDKSQEGTINNKHEFQEINNILVKYPNKRLVMVTSDTDILHADQFYMLDDSFSLSQLDLVSQTEILKCKVNFQGSIVDLKSLAIDETTLKCSLTANDVIKLLSGCQEFEVGCKLNSPEKYYISRTLVRKELLSPDILRKKQSLLAVSGISMTELQQLLPPDEIIQTFNSDGSYNNNCNYFVINNMTEFRELSMSHSNIHWIHKTEKGFVWRSSKGNMDSVICCLQAERLSYSGIEEVAKLSQQIVLIVAQPGMGKSTELTYLGSTLKQENLSTWVIRVDLYKHQDFLNDESISAYELLLNAGKFDTKFQKDLFKHQLDNEGNVVILLDGFDEINPKHTSRVLSLLRELMSSKVKTIWVTSRHVMMRRLENELCTLSFDFELFTRDEQMNFLVKFWEKLNLNLCPLHTFVSRLLEQTALSLNDKLMNFTGIPLQTRMLAEVFEPEAKQYCTTGQLTLLPKLDLLHLYEWFIEKKWDIYFNKMEVSLNNAMVAEIREDLKEIFDQKLMSCALVSFLDHNEIINLGTSKRIINENTKFLDKFKNRGERTGLIVNVLNNKAVFLHQTFAEYFVALWLAQDHYHCCKEQLFGRKFEVVRKFFDRILCKDFPLHTYVLNQDKCMVDDRVDLKENCVSIVEILLNFGANPNIEDRVLFLRPLQLAIKIEAWPAVGLLLERNAKREEDLIPMRNNMKKIKQNVLKDASSRGFVQLIKVMLSWGVKLQERIDDGLVTLGNSFIYNQCNMLHLAARHGQKALIKFLLDKGADINATDTCKQTPLIYAIQYEQIEAAEFLIYQRADFNICSKNHINPLHLSAQKGLGSLVTMLVNCKANVNREDINGNTVLHFAVEKCNIASLKSLLQAKPHMLENNKGVTPLMKASELGKIEVVKLLSSSIKKYDDFNAALCSATKGGHLNVVKWLLKCGAMVSAPNIEGLTALHIAGREGYTEIAECLLQHETNAAICKDTHTGNTPLHEASRKGHIGIVKLLLCRQKESVNMCNNRGDTSLHVAAGKGHLKIMNWLVKFKADPDIPNNQGDRPLHTAAFWGCLEAVAFLLKLKKTDVNLKSKIDVDACNKFKNTALHIAVEQGHKKIHNADVRACNASLDMPVHIASRLGHVNIISCLLQGGTLTDYNKEGYMPHHIAALEGNLQVLQKLIQLKACYEDRDRRENTMLSLAVKNNHLHIVEWLIEQGAKCNTFNKKLRTPLHLAAGAGNMEIVKCLLKGGADLEVCDKNGCTPLNLAKNFGHVAVCFITLLLFVVVVVVYTFDF